MSVWLSTRRDPQHGPPVIDSSTQKDPRHPVSHDSSPDQIEALPRAEPAPLAVAAALLDVVGRRLAPGGGAWLEGAADELRAPLDQEAFATVYTVAARRVGKAPVALDAADVAYLACAGVAWVPAHWGTDELARAVLLLRAAAALAEPAFASLVEECYARGDNRERQAVLRSLALLPAPVRFLALAVDACRTSIQPVFEAIACENPYPAAYFPELHFNQMVLKALFVGVALRRVVGLEGRTTAELRRMAADYASERRAAGRTVPPDIDDLLHQRGCPS